MDQNMLTPEPLDTELQAHLTESQMGLMIHHPLIISLYNETMNTIINQHFRSKTEALNECEINGNWQTFVFMHERPYRIDALEEILFTNQINDPTIVSQLIADVWIDSENINQELDRWIDIWDLSLDKNFLMNADECKELNDLPDTFEVYRGVGHSDAVTHGLSWTTNRDKAIWFAKRFSENDNSYLATGTVSKTNVLSYFLRRGENEIVIMPEHVSNTSIHKLIS